MAAKYKRPSSSGFFETMDSSAPSARVDELPVVAKASPQETAIVYCEGSFGGLDGATANGLVRSSEKYKILSVIDSEKAEQDAGEVLDGKRNGIAIYRDLGTALAQAGRAPAYLIFGMKLTGGVFSQSQRRVLLRAIAYRINIACGSDELLNKDPEFMAACEKYGVVIRAI